MLLPEGWRLLGQNSGTEVILTPFLSPFKYWEPIYLSECWQEHFIRLTYSFSLKGKRCMHASSVGCLRRCAEFHEEIGEEVNEGGDHSGSFRSEQSPLPILATLNMQMQESRLYKYTQNYSKHKRRKPMPYQKLDRSGWGRGGRYFKCTIAVQVHIY